MYCCVGGGRGGGGEEGGAGLEEGWVCEVAVSEAVSEPMQEARATSTSAESLLVGTGSLFVIVARDHTRVNLLNSHK